MSRFFKLIESEINEDDIPVLAVTVETSYKNIPPVEFRVYKINAKEYKLLSYCEMIPEDYILALREQEMQNGKKITFSEAEDALFSNREYVLNYMRPRILTLTMEQAETVLNAVHSNWDGHIVRGLDGHSYFVKIYGESITEKMLWCVVSKEFESFAKMINMFVDIYNPQNKEKYYCMVRK